MKYTVCKSMVYILGGVWWPMGALCGQVKELNKFDVENCRDKKGKITRKSLERWLNVHAGDFSSIKDFSASIEDGNKTIEFPWTSEENEMDFIDTQSEVE